MLTFYDFESLSASNVNRRRDVFVLFCSLFQHIPGLGESNFPDLRSKKGLIKNINEREKPIFDNFSEIFNNSPFPTKELRACLLTNWRQFFMRLSSYCDKLRHNIIKVVPQ